MIIADSKVNTASDRTYTKRSVKTSYTAYRNGISTTRSFGGKLTNTYMLNESYKNNDSNQSFAQFQEHQNSNSTMYGIFSYAKTALPLDANGNVLTDNVLNGNAANDKALTNETTNQASQTDEALENLKNTYNEISNRLFTSVLDMLKRLRFRGGFEDNYFFQNYQKSSSFGSSLTLTNNLSPSYFSVERGHSTFYEETECTKFRGEGTVVTADGRELTFGLNVEMSRSFTEYNKVSFVENYPQVLTDPLVIHLDSNPVSVSDQTFFFDLDCDGKKEKIAQLNAGSGYLALDKNNDGIINDGSELFGPNTGNGFDELAAYDSDGNGWIDEADEIYKHLKVWTRDSEGNEKLLTLKEADVGAIYLGNSKTEFSLKDDAQNLKGQVRRTGMYLHENGDAGAIQQIDF